MFPLNEDEVAESLSAAEQNSQSHSEQNSHRITPCITVSKTPDVSTSNFGEPNTIPSPSTLLSPQPTRASRSLEPTKVSGRRGAFNQMRFVQMLEKANLRTEKWRKYTIEEVALHNRPDDAWVILKGKVYNIQPYFAYHPGGEEILLTVAGKDCTTEFNSNHPWVNAELLLDQLCLGTVVSAKQKG
ncbi:cytochrome b5 family heme/steroid binding domain-containing protein [Cardiosporidium cionae]|uniref:Cytochrome b5 family heme/steroid binding domain-containing protein n=1 Tax=Cardiosporidium cionae TaxID=476202 RepID=A0ABQ7J9E6_9APIC|nr:cytochrome b5 family heme/steroid binding domain-containing protein [Cardiosporidium cionae]|eukprot:KAF8820590.1 cytochrome b5 family heme/steroid binding domain-containing protein [Cardiosporidium cionae]